jgi:elongation factor P--beta-lysine ligase
MAETIKHYEYRFLTLDETHITDEDSYIDFIKLYYYYKNPVLNSIYYEKPNIDITQDISADTIYSKLMALGSTFHIENIKFIIIATFVNEDYYFTAGALKFAEKMFCVEDYNEIFVQCTEILNSYNEEFDEFCTFHLFSQVFSEKKQSYIYNWYNSIS